MRSVHLALFFAVAALGVAGCDTPLLQLGAEVENTCATNDSCGQGGVCLEQRCVSTDADLDGLMLVIDIPETEQLGGGTTQVVFPGRQGVPLSGMLTGGYRIGYTVALEAPAKATLGIKVEASAFPDCAGLFAEDGTLPAKAQLEPKVFNDDGKALNGVPLPSYLGESDPEDMTTNLVTLSVPPGQYDVYIVADIPDSGETDYSTCIVPPTLVRGQPIDKEYRFEAGDTALGDIAGRVENFDATGWTIDLVENRDGRVVSSAVVLGDDCNALPRYCAYTLKHWEDLTQLVDPVLRLRPPHEADQTEPTTVAQGLPTILAKLEALNLFGEDYDLDLEELDGVEPLAIVGNVTSADDSDPVPSTLLIQSTELLDGTLGDIAGYSTTVETDNDGEFSVMVLPGKYSVIAAPNLTDFAVTRNEIDLNASTLMGTSIIVQPKRIQSGRVITPQNVAAHEVPVTLVPTSGAVTSFINAELEAELQPTPASSTTDNRGAFNLFAGPGVFNLMLQPTINSDLPWAVLPNLEIKDLEDQPLEPLNIAISNPVVLEGRVRNSNELAVEGARIRAFIQPDKLDEDDNPPVIQIGDASSTGGGRYELRLPARLAAFVTTP